MSNQLSFRCKSLGLGLSLKTHDNFLGSLGIGIEKFGIGKKVLVSLSENLVAEKKSRYWYRKNLSRIKSLGLGIGQNFGLVTQWAQSTSSPQYVESGQIDQSKRPNKCINSFLITGKSSGPYFY